MSLVSTEPKFDAAVIDCKDIISLVSFMNKTSFSNSWCSPSEVDTRDGLLELRDDGLSDPIDPSSELEQGDGTFFENRGVFAPCLEDFAYTDEIVPFSLRILRLLTETPGSSNTSWFCAVFFVLRHISTCLFPMTAYYKGRWSFYSVNKMTVPLDVMSLCSRTYLFLPYGIVTLSFMCVVIIIYIVRKFTGSTYLVLRETPASRRHALGK